MLAIMLIPRNTNNNSNSNSNDNSNSNSNSNDNSNSNANVNIEIPANSTGTPQNDRFATIADLIRPLLEDVSYQGIYIRIINEQLFKEQKQNTNYWYNFKLNIT